jgi:hypothetical protein
MKAFKAMKRVYLILIAIHIGQAPNGPRISRRKASTSERSGRVKVHVGRRGQWFVNRSFVDFSLIMSSILSKKSKIGIKIEKRIKYLNYSLNRQSVLNIFRIQNRHISIQGRCHDCTVPKR